MRVRLVTLCGCENIVEIVDPEQEWIAHSWGPPQFGETQAQRNRVFYPDPSRPDGPPGAPVAYYEIWAGDPRFVALMDKLESVASWEPA